MNALELDITMPVQQDIHPEFTNCVNHHWQGVRKRDELQTNRAADRSGDELRNAESSQIDLAKIQLQRQEKY